MGELKIEVHGEIAVATMSNVARHNAQDRAIHKALCEFWDYLRDNDALRVAILTGDGDRAFSSGADLKERAEAYEGGSNPDDPKAIASVSYGYPHLHKTGKIVIAAIHGYCFAGGLLTALGCDLRLCSRSAAFGNPQAMRGRGSRVPMLLRRAGVPLAVIFDLVVTGERIDAQRAYDLGLVSRLCEDKEDLMATAMSVAGQICANSPRAVRAAKLATESGIIDWPMTLALPVWDQVTEAMIHDEDTKERTLQFSSHTGPGGQKA
jgi:E-phenylitaconyl-CoA hydratase